MTIVAHASERGQHPITTSTETGCEQHCRESRVLRQPVVGVELIERVNGLLLPLVRRVRHRGFEHANQRERCSREERTAEGYRAVPSVTVALLQPPLQPRSEKGEQERDQGQQQEANDLVDASVVLPIRKGLRRTGLCVGVVPVDDERGTE